MNGSGIKCDICGGDIDMVPHGQSGQLVALLIWVGGCACLSCAASNIGAIQLPPCEYCMDAVRAVVE